MTSAKDVIKSTKAPVFKSVQSTPAGAIGYDNVRDDIERVKKAREVVTEDLTVGQNIIVGGTVDGIDVAAIGAASHGVNDANTSSAPVAHLTDTSTHGVGEVADAADLTTHIADTTTHGTTGDIVGISDTQTLTNKTINLNDNTIQRYGYHLEATNLLITRPTAATVLVTADTLILPKTAQGGRYLATSVSETIDITVSGAGGLASGAEAANTWYYIWIGWNGTAVNGFLSTSSSHNPLRPTGYDWCQIVGAVRNDNASNFIDFNQVGKEVYYDAEQTVLSVTTSATSFTDVACATAVPPISRKMSLFMAIYDGAGNPYMAVRPNGTTFAAFKCAAIRQTGNNTTNPANTEMWCDASQIIEYKSSTSTLDCHIHVIGYTITAL